MADYKRSATIPAAGGRVLERTARGAHKTPSSVRNAHTRSSVRTPRIPNIHQLVSSSQSRAIYENTNAVTLPGTPPYRPSISRKPLLAPPTRSQGSKLAALGAPEVLLGTRPLAHDTPRRIRNTYAPVSPKTCES